MRDLPEAVAMDMAMMARDDGVSGTSDEGLACLDDFNREAA